MNYQEKVESLLLEAYNSRTNNVKKSIVLANKAFEISHKKSDELLIAKSLNQLSLFLMIIGDNETSQIKALEAIVIFEKLENSKGIADSKYNLAGIFYKTYNFQAGIVYLLSALKIYQDIEDWHNMSRVEKSLGTIYEYIGDQQSAIASYENAIQYAKIVNDKNLESNSYNNLSGILLKHNKNDEALEMIQRSIRLKKETNDTRGMAFAIYGRGKVYTKTKEFDKAEQDFLNSIKIHQEMGEKLGLGMAYNKLGFLYLEMQLNEKAKQTAMLGLELSKKYNIALVIFKCNYLMYRIFKTEKNYLKALDFLEIYTQEKELALNTQTLKVMGNYDIIIRMKTLEIQGELDKEKQEIQEKVVREQNNIRLKQEFLSNMSHEIRTPLNAITTIVSLLDDHVNDENKKLHESLKIASNNLIVIINDVLDFTKLETNKSKVDRRPLNLGFFADNIINTYKSLAQKKGLALNLITTNFNDNYYLLDDTKLGQIIGNLIGNAIKFTTTGFVNLEINVIKSTKIFDTIEFKVKDTGEGIAPKNLKLIFDSFYQIKPILTKQQNGTGLGLAIVKRLITLKGSEIKVKSELNLGSEFYFELKVKKTEIPIVAKTEYSNLLNGKKVLLADDTLINALLLQKVLQKWGVITEHVINGNLAVEKAKKEKFDFILMDIHMPEMNGYEATKLIKTNENINNVTPIFALTADVLAESNSEFFEFFSGFVLKPIEIESLYHSLMAFNEI